MTQDAAYAIQIARTVVQHELDALRQKAQDNLVIVCRARDRRCLSLAHHYDLKAPVVADADGRLSDLFRVTAPPMAIVIDPEGRLQSTGRPMSGDDLERQVLPQHNGHNGHSNELVVHAVVGRQEEV